MYGSWLTRKNTNASGNVILKKKEDETKSTNYDTGEPELPYRKS